MEGAMVEEVVDVDEVTLGGQTSGGREGDGGEYERRLQVQLVRGGR